MYKAQSCIQQCLVEPYLHEDKLEGLKHCVCDEHHADGARTGTHTTIYTPKLSKWKHAGEEKRCVVELE